MIKRQTPINEDALKLLEITSFKTSWPVSFGGDIYSADIFVGLIIWKWIKNQLLFLDGSGYVEDGREIFDEELADDQFVKPDSKYETRL